MDRPEFDQPEKNGKFSDGLLMPIFAVMAVFLFVILCFYAYDHVMKNKNDNEVVVLNGDSGSFKVAPENPGGMQVEHTDKAVYNTVSGQHENIDNAKVNVVSQEAPVSQEQLAGSVGTVPPMPDEAKSSTVTINGNDPVADTKNPREEVNNILNPKKSDPLIDKSISVSNSASNLNTQSEVKPVAMPDSAGTPIKLSDSDSDISGAEKLTDGNAKNSAIDKAPEKTVKADVKKEVDKSTGESKTVVQFRQPPKSFDKAAGKSTSGSMSAIAPSSVGSGKYYVQVSSHASKSEAESDWKKISKKYSAELSGQSKNITQAEVKGKSYYRLSFGPFADKSAASTQCGILKAKGQDCIIQKY